MTRKLCVEELLKNYEMTLQSICNLLLEYIDTPSDSVVEVSILGAPTRLTAQELKLHINSQMIFLIKKIEEIKVELIENY